MWVADRGFSSAENRRYLRKGDHAYIIGEKLRSGSPEVQAASSSRSGLDLLELLGQLLGEGVQFAPARR